MPTSRDEQGESQVFSGWWRRAAATIIDTVVVTLPTSAVLWASGFDLGEYYGEGSSIVATRMVDVTYMLVDAVFATLYFTPLMVAWNGQTLGKRALGIRVIRADGAPLDAKTVFVRQVAIQYFALGLVYVLALINYLLPLRDRERRAGHDRLVNTRVVRVHRATPTADDSA